LRPARSPRPPTAELTGLFSSSYLRVHPERCVLSNPPPHTQGLSRKVTRGWGWVKVTRVLANLRQKFSLEAMLIRCCIWNYAPVISRATPRHEFSPLHVRAAPATPADAPCLRGGYRDGSWGTRRQRREPGSE